MHECVGREMKAMRSKGRKQGRFMALSGLTKLAAPPNSQYPLLIVDSTGSPVFFLCEWYRRKKAVDPGRTPDSGQLEIYIDGLYNRPPKHGASSQVNVTRITKTRLALA